MTSTLPPRAQASREGAGTTAASLAEVTEFAYRQGLGKNLLQRPQPIDDGQFTASTVPPLLARGGTGVPLSPGVTDSLAVGYPAGRAQAASDVLGQVLLAALGLHRREHSHRYPDHRAVASGRAKYPVHAFVLDGATPRYLDVYRHALVDVPVGPALITATSPRPGTVAVILAARYEDLPAAYQQARASVTETELGIALRSIAVTAQLYGARATVGGVAAARAAELLAATGPGTWSLPVVLTLDAVPAGPSQPLLRWPARAFEAADRHLEAPDSSALEAARISRTRQGGPAEAAPGDRLVGIPSASAAPDCGCPPGTWAQTLADRSAGRVAGRRHGFALRPHRLPAGCLADLLAWVTQPPAAPELAAVGRRITLRVAVQRAGAYDTGLYRWQDGALQAEFTDPALLRLLERRGGQSSSPDVEIGIRHANLGWLFTADLDALLAEFGPAAWSLSQLYCGWALHGLGTAAAAHGLISRPSRSYDEPTMQQTLRLPRKEVPMFMAICGRSAFDEPTLDLRS